MRREGGSGGENWRPWLMGLDDTLDDGKNEWHFSLGDLDHYGT